MDKKKLVLLAIICVAILVASLAVYFQLTLKQNNSWLALNDFVVYRQDVTWAGSNTTTYMFWNITSLNGDMANIRLVSGINISNGSVDISTTEEDSQVNISTRQVINCSLQSDIGSKFPLWIPQSVKVGDAIQTSYGDSTISPSQNLKIMDQNRSCWVVAYAYGAGTNMDRYYDTATGICLQIRTHIFSNGISIAINETAVQTNIKSLL
jgi:hypothetical protein